MGLAVFGFFRVPACLPGSCMYGMYRPAGQPGPRMPFVAGHVPALFWLAATQLATLAKPVAQHNMPYFVPTICRVSIHHPYTPPPHRPAGRACVAVVVVRTRKKRKEEEGKRKEKYNIILCNDRK
ncbi:hypothetical protein BZA05DRAFT_410990 [Tricharina praecox]|uniref:uncharacterized protein n=1 Tax=Tricharina praecox TaxID=43433 RepID=UPI00221F7598|nr:uncharacterized protein BZA05DRAFT_410990 [Tricharina praecox]KAI5843244.1 hypothetical protein BZA05DRAFT_410990 [Tricharina praecox]